MACRSRHDLPQCSVAFQGVLGGAGQFFRRRDRGSGIEIDILRQMFLCGVTVLVRGMVRAISRCKSGRVSKLGTRALLTGLSIARRHTLVFNAVSVDGDVRRLLSIPFCFAACGQIRLLCGVRRHHLLQNLWPVASFCMTIIRRGGENRFLRKDCQHGGCQARGRHRIRKTICFQGSQEWSCTRDLSGGGVSAFSFSLAASGMGGCAFRRHGTGLSLRASRLAEGSMRSTCEDPPFGCADVRINSASFCNSPLITPTCCKSRS